MPTLIIVFILLIGGAGATYYAMNSPQSAASQNNEIEETADKKVTNTKEKDPPEPVAEPSKAELKSEQKKHLTEIIASAQDTVYTIFASSTQGSGFLYDTEGHVVTNAHVVEGELDVYVKTIDEEEYPGKVIGYSAETDIAVIEVPNLANQQPNQLDIENEAAVGEEVIALGSPLGLENTATMGFVTGKNRDFTIDIYTYDNLYQMSAPISPGSSGGPLISKDEKVLAINSAVSIADNSIGFSIPLFHVAGLIQKWIDQPMSEEEILSQFYNTNGNFFFEDLWEFEDGYFDGGEYDDEDEFYDYWEYDDSYSEEYENDFWNEYDEDYYYDDQQDYGDDWENDALYEYDDEWEDDYNDEYDGDWEDDYNDEYDEDVQDELDNENEAHESENNDIEEEQTDE